MVVRLCITVPDKIHKKLEEFMKTFAKDGKKPNTSKYVSGLIETHTPEIDID